jgi:hypothetical protein
MKEEVELRICELAASRGVTIDFLLFMEEMEFTPWADNAKPTNRKLQQLFEGFVQQTFLPCIGDVLFSSSKTMKRLMSFTSETTPYDAVMSRTDWERALLLVCSLFELARLYQRYNSRLSVDSKIG